MARAAADWLRDPTDRIWQGAALETLVFHELRVYNEISQKHRPIAYYRTPAGVEVDFIVETTWRSSTKPPSVIAIEAKRADKWNREWERPLRSLTSLPRLRADKLIAVYTGKRFYRFDPIDVMPVESFFEALYGGEII